MTVFLVGLVVATITSGAIDAAMDEDSSAQARPATRSAEPAPALSTEPARTPSPVSTPTPTPTPASTSTSTAAAGGVCLPLYELPRVEISPVPDPVTGVTPAPEPRESPEPAEEESDGGDDCLHGPPATSYGYSSSFPGGTPWQFQPQPTHAPGYLPGFGDSGWETGTERDRRVPITTERGGVPDLAPTVPRAPAPRVPAFIP